MSMKIFLLFVIAALSNLFSVNVAQADKLAICGAFEKELMTATSIGELWGSPYIEYEYTGLEFIFLEGEGGTPSTAFVNSVNPFLDDKLPKGPYKGNAWKLDGEIVLGVNGKSIDGLTEEAFFSELEKEQISLKFDSFEEPLNLKKDVFYEHNVYLSVTVDDIAAVDTKSASVRAKFRTNLVWHDARFAKIAQKVISKGKFENAASVGFSCVFETNFLTNIVYPYPVLILNDLISDGVFPTNKSVSFEYYPPDFCDEECDEFDKKYGKTSFEIIKNLQGSVKQSFDLVAFPFDEQSINFDFEVSQPETGEEVFFNLVASSLSDDQIETAKSEINLAEWEINGSGSYTVSYKSDIKQLHLPTTRFYFDIKRYSDYYVFKLAMPITLILIVCWSVFWIRPDELEARLTLSVVSLLSLIAYNFVVDQDLPKLGYLTMADFFIIYTYLFAGVPIMQTVLCKALCDRGKENLANRIDRDFRIYHPASYVLMILILFYQYVPVDI